MVFILAGQIEEEQVARASLDTEGDIRDLSDGFLIPQTDSIHRRSRSPGPQTSSPIKQVKGKGKGKNRKRTRSPSETAPPTKRRTLTQSSDTAEQTPSTSRAADKPKTSQQASTSTQSTSNHDIIVTTLTQRIQELNDEQQLHQHENQTLQQQITQLQHQLTQHQHNHQPLQGRRRPPPPAFSKRDRIKVGDRIGTVQGSGGILVKFDDLPRGAGNYV